MNKYMIIIRGHPGSGKTTLAKKIIEKLTRQWSTFSTPVNIQHFETDQFFVKENGDYEFDPTLIGVAHADTFNRLKVFFSACESKKGNQIPIAVLSNTFTKLWEFENYLKYAKENGIKVTVLRAVGNYQNVHGVPVSTIDRMKKNYELYDGELPIHGKNIDIVFNWT